MILFPPSWLFVPLFLLVGALQVFLLLALLRAVRGRVGRGANSVSSDPVLPSRTWHITVFWLPSLIATVVINLLIWTLVAFL